MFFISSKSQILIVHFSPLFFSRGAFCLSFSNNGMYLAIGGITEPTFSSGRNSGHNARNASYPIRVYNVLTGDRVASLEGHQDLVYSVNWSFDDEYVDIGVWVQKKNYKGISSILLISCSNLVSSSSDGSVRVWLFLGDGSVRTSAVFQHPSYVYSATIHPTAKSPR